MTEREGKTEHGVSFRRGSGLILFFLVGLCKRGIYTEHCTEYSNRYGGYNYRFSAVAEPYNKNRSESRFWKAVEQYEERFGNFEDISVKPHKYGSCNGGNHNKYKAYKCFINGFPYMAYEKTVFVSSIKHLTIRFGLLNIKSR